MKAEFITSALLPDEYPTRNDANGQPLPEIAIVGRSNVGKSSLMNHLFKTKHLAKVSGKPGKTERINFFLVDEAFFLVDLPGYGFAKVSKKEKEKWGHSLEKYFNNRPIKAVIFLVDSRRKLTEDDQMFLEWAEFKKIPILMVLTKSDKLSQAEKREERLSQYSPLLYSVKAGKCREYLLHMLNKILWD